jgi:deazaflavin-dependent oxidoreductase (nitroreductase family)
MSWVLRSPLHGLLSKGMLLITVTGRKTGKKYTTPVGYYRAGEDLWVLTSRDRTWWRNLRGGAKVDLLLRRDPVTAFAEPALDQKTVENQLCEYLRQMPQAAKGLGIRVHGGQANAKDIQHVASQRLFVKIRPIT